MVPTASAQSCAVGSPRSPGPNSTTSVPGRRQLAVQVDDELVHADPAADRAQRVVDPHRRGVAGGARDAVAVPGRHEADGGVAVGDPGVAVGDAVAGGDRLAHRQPGAHGHRRAQAEPRGARRAPGRGRTTRCRTGPGRSAPTGAGRAAAELARWRTSGSSPAAAASVERLAEGRLLGVVGGVVGLVAGGEVRPDAGDRDPARPPRASAARANRSSQSARAAPPRDRPVSTLSCTRAPPTAAISSSSVDGVRRHLDAGRDGGGVVLAGHAQPAQQRPAVAGRAQRQRLVDRGDAEPVGAGLAGGRGRPRPCRGRSRRP